MNKSPLNYLITLALGAILWVITAIFYGGTFAESIILTNKTPEEFLGTLRVMLGIAAGLGIINCLIWYYYGSLDSTAGNLPKAKRIWWGSFIMQIVFAIAILVVFIIIYMAEGVLTNDWIITFLLISVHTWFFFWLCTFFFSPRTVKFIPLFR